MDLLRLPVKHFKSCSKAHDPHKTHQTQVIDSIYQPRTKNAQMLKWPRCVLRWLVLPWRRIAQSGWWTRQIPSCVAGVPSSSKEFQKGKFRGKHVWRHCEGVPSREDVLLRKEHLELWDFLSFGVRSALGDMMVLWSTWYLQSLATGPVINCNLSIWFTAGVAFGGRFVRMAQRPAANASAVSVSSRHVKNC